MENKDKKEKRKQKKSGIVLVLHILRKRREMIKKILVVVAVFSAAGTIATAAWQYSTLKRIKNAPAPQVNLPVQASPAKEKMPELPNIDTADWKTYSNPYYGFELKHPSDWKKVTAKSAPRGSKWQYRYLFRKSEIAEDNPYIGFDVVVYDTKKAKELRDTDEFPKLKDQEQESSDACAFGDGHLFKSPDYPAEEIYISPNDDCYNTNFFFSLTREEYIYNLVLVEKEETNKPVNPKKEAIEYFPEFFGVASNIDLVDIVRFASQTDDPQNKETSSTGIACIKFPPEILAKLKNPPMPPDSEKKDGKRICHVLAEGKKDNPHKSNKNPKGGWAGCCYDPDEVPNPRCCYPVGSVYEKYLKKYFEKPFPLRK